MLTQKMLVEKNRIDRLCGPVELKRAEGGAISKTDSSTTAFLTASAAVEPQANGPWPATSTPGTCSGLIPGLVEALGSHDTRVIFVVRADRVFANASRHWHRTVEVVGMGRSHARDFPLRLSPADGVARMRVNDAPDFRKLLVKIEMDRGIRGGPQPFFDRLAILYRRRSTRASSARIAPDFRRSDAEESVPWRYRN